MKQFNLEEYLTNPNKKVITGSGKSVRIICTNRLDELYPIIALVNYDYSEKCYGYTACGKINIHQDIDCDLDLFFVPEKKEGWVNVYKYRFRCTHLSGIIYSSKEEAESDAEVHESGINTYITTIKIEWEE